ncbi:hypothetical protein HaLaN_00786 [Haematococcus lacustris]|uniref:Uncharacterized protein n=1 Tax=Haematococcus lacustris TaxID=44745 RepID=A0A699YGP7_HAELA|nr:hypothetical protein HaLaN_00786 [Haematococcus lacustris]
MSPEKPLSLIVRGVGGSMGGMHRVLSPAILQPFGHNKCGAWLGIGIAIGAAAGVVIGITVGWMLGRMRSVSRDTSGVRTAAETPRDLAASTNYDPIGLGPLQTAAARIKTTGIQQTPSDTQMSKSDNWKAHGPSLDQNTPDAHVPEEAVAQAHVHVEIPPIPPATLQTDAGNGQTRASARHQRNASNTSTYDVDDLDSDWQNLLDNVWSHACLQPGNSIAIAQCTALTRLIVVGGCPPSARWAASHAPSGATGGCSQACSSDWDSWCGVCLGSSSGGDRQVPFMECGSPQTSSLAIACPLPPSLVTADLQP